MSLIEHIESNLGVIKNSWKLNLENTNLQVVKFLNKPFEDLVTYCTVGLSNFDLKINNVKTIKQELIFTVPKDQLYYNDEDVASFILTFAKHIIETQKALLRGEIVGPGNILFRNTKSNSIYCSIPVFYEDDFHVYKGSSPETIFVWLIPLLKNDALFIKQNGWNAFEDILENIEDISIFWDLEKSLVFN